jgi:hypothetical protein
MGFFDKIWSATKGKSGRVATEKAAETLGGYALGVVGATVGGMLAGPTGAAIGFASFKWIGELSACCLAAAAMEDVAKRDAERLRAVPIAAGEVERLLRWGEEIDRRATDDEANAKAMNELGLRYLIGAEVP